MVFRDLITNYAQGRLDTSRLVFYTKRLAREASVRRVGAVLLVLALVFQVVTFLSPPKPSNAASPNDIIQGGFTSKADLLAKYDQGPPAVFGNGAIVLIYGYFGITRNDIVNATDTTINGSMGLWSIGHSPHSPQDQLINVGFNQAVYIRPLSSWGTSATYRALTGIDSRGQRFYILYDCGNAAFPGIPGPPPPPPGHPALTISKTVPAGSPAAGSVVHRGQVLTFQIHVNNPGNAAATNVLIADTFPKYTTGARQGGFAFAGDQGESRGGSNTSYWWKLDRYNGGGSGYTDLVLVVANDAPDGTRICNQATVGSSEIGTVSSAPVCYTVSVPQIVGTPKLQYVKTADNLTQTINGAPTNANNTTVPAGTVIRYNLIARNVGTAAASNVAFNENISDILEYADLTDAGGASQSGSGRQILLNWPAATVNAGSAITHSFTVKVKDPIPATPTSVSDPQSFDLRMDNIFQNNAVSIHLPPPPVKKVEQVTQTLPQTGAGNTSLILAVLAAIASFLYLRSRLLRQELAIAQSLKEGGQRG